MVHRTYNLDLGTRCNHNGHYKPIQFIISESGCHEVVSHKAKHPFGYPRIQFKGRVYKMHRVIWTYFRGDIAPGLCVLHKCDNPKCINIDHLFLGTNDDNIADMVRKNRNQKGGQHYNAKLDEQKVREIRLLGQRGLTQNKIATEYGVTRRVIGRVLNRSIWKHV